MIYCTGQANSEGVYIMMRVGGYGTGDCVVINWFFKIKLYTT